MRKGIEKGRTKGMTRMELRVGGGRKRGRKEERQGKCTRRLMEMLSVQSPGSCSASSQNIHAFIHYRSVLTYCPQIGMLVEQFIRDVVKWEHRWVRVMNGCGQLIFLRGCWGKAPEVDGGIW